LILIGEKSKNFLLTLVLAIRFIYYKHENIKNSESKWKVFKKKNKKIVGEIIIFLQVKFGNNLSIVFQKNDNIWALLLIIISLKNIETFNKTFNN
jgi:ribosomal protein S4E